MKQANMQRRGRLVLLAAVLIQLFSGILYIWSIVKEELILKYQWSDAQATLPYTVATVVFSVSMFFAGLVQDKKGPRVMALLGTAMLGCGLILSGFATSVGSMILTFSLIVGAGIGINNVVTTPAAVKWYPPEKKGMITGLVVAAVALASLMYSPLVTYMAGALGLKYTFILLGAAVLVITFSLAFLVVNPPPDFQGGGSLSKKEETPGQSATGVDLSWRAMLKTRDFYLLFVMFAFSSSAGLMVIGHLTTIAKLQAGWSGGFLLVMLIALFNALGRFAGGALSDRIGRVTLMRIAFILQAVNMALFSRFDSIFTLILGVALAGLCYGATFAVFPATIADYYGIRNLGANYGLLFLAWGLGGVLGPQIAGSIFDRNGSYTGAYWLACGLLTLAVASSFALKKPKKDRRKTLTKDEVR